jgi:hypothetical protein
MHRLTVSDEIMDQLRALCLNGGQSEDYVLRHLLGCPPKAAPDGNGDFIDATYGVRFAEGSRIFRTYKGRPYSAQVSNGRWVLDGDAGPAGTYNSLNQLSQGIIDGNENAWMFWFRQTPGGQPRRIAELRDPALVQRRPRCNHPRKYTGDHTEDHAREPAIQPVAPPPRTPYPSLSPETACRPLPPALASDPATDPEAASATPQAPAGKPWEPA